MSPSNLSVIVHGGAGKLSPKRAREKLPGLQQAVKAAWAELSKGKPGEFAVAAALREMEADDAFNAGFGGYPNRDGIVLEDIGLMRGDRSFVSLLNVRRVKFPSAISLDMLMQNRSIMSVWTHELMLDVDQAPEFIKERYGWVKTHEELLSPNVLERIQSGEAEFGESGETHGTVGCVVRDAAGEICAGTSTGGINAKDNGRIGDSPVIGAGVYADNDLCGLSTTGHGESMLGALLSGFIVGRVRAALREDAVCFSDRSKKLDEILREEFDELSRKCGSKGGAMIVIPKGGPPTYAFNSQMVSIAMQTGTLGKVEEADAFIAVKDGTFLRPGEEPLPET